MCIYSRYLHTPVKCSFFLGPEALPLTIETRYNVEKFSAKKFRAKTSFATKCLYAVVSQTIRRVEAKQQFIICQREDNKLNGRFTRASCIEAHKIASCLRKFSKVDSIKECSPEKSDIMIKFYCHDQLFSEESYTYQRTYLNSCLVKIFTVLVGSVNERFEIYQEKAGMTSLDGGKFVEDMYRGHEWGAIIGWKKKGFYCAIALPFDETQNFKKGYSTIRLYDYTGNFSVPER
ncbi:hypothetical protein RF11_05899 [Thelohanellus kitauei]|uniref:Uncharacterized protein n=1 Tax=Thelohanellus kitauei TaxID=669202 RepID=A0A0C2MRC4_THEKT|nr:hypothetical protein RF11_05899 [Thelohanellus kitauei]